MIIPLKRYNRKGNVMSVALNNITGKSAEQILSQYGNNDSVATRIFTIARNIGIKLEPKDFSDIENQCNMKSGSILGCVIENNDLDTLAIYVQSKLPEIEFFQDMTEKEKRKILRRRQRFTVAHEIAHACMHLGDQGVEFKIDYRDKIHNTDDCEYRANVFAGELLVPKDVLADVCSRLIRPSLDALVDIFDVSHSVMRERLRYLGLTYIIDGGVK